MDRRNFTKNAMGIVAGTFAATSLKAKSKLNKPKKESKKVAKKEKEEIKFIQAKRHFQNPSTKQQGVCTSLLCFSDVHLVKEHLEEIAEFYNLYKSHSASFIHYGGVPQTPNNFTISNIDDALHLGDSVGAYYTAPFDLWDILPTALNVIGNHDTYIKDSPRFVMPDKDKYATYFKKYIKKWNVVQPENAEEEGKCYWYKDYNKDVRVIAIDCNIAKSKPQLEWFKKSLEDALKSKLKVVIATHFPPPCDKVLECNFTSIDYTQNPKKYPEVLGEFVSAIDSFIENGGTFVSWICGHLHHDMVMYAKGSKNKQLVIAMECATDFDWWTDADHIKGTSANACWEIISIESISNVIKIARFGNNYDHYLRRKDSFCYNFKEHKLIYSS